MKSSVKCDTPHRSLPLVEFIAYTAYRTRSPDTIIFGAMYLLLRLKSSVRRTRGSTGERLFITALMVAWKVISDDVYSNKSWAAISRGLFTIKEINRMERDLCGFLQWRLHIDGEALSRFQERLQRGFNNSDSVTIADALIQSPSTPHPAYQDKISCSDGNTTSCALPTILELSARQSESTCSGSARSNIDNCLKCMSYLLL